MIDRCTIIKIKNNVEIIYRYIIAHDNDIDIDIINRYNITHNNNIEIISRIIIINNNLLKSKILKQFGASNCC